jgi:hypothetical protein
MTTPTERRLEFHGDTVETQRLTITTEHLSDMTGDFVEVHHGWGDGSVTTMLFTNAEARYLSETLLKILDAWASRTSAWPPSLGPLSGDWNNAPLQARQAAGRKAAAQRKKDREP